MVEFSSCVACKVVLASFEGCTEESFFQAFMEETCTVVLMEEFHTIGNRAR